MAGLLDLFAIGFNSEGLNDFEQNLKRSQKELDNYEQKVKDCEGALKDLEKQGEKDSDVYKSIESDLEQAKRGAEKFRKEVETMQGSNSAQLLKMKKNFGSLVKTLGLLATVGVTLKKSLEFYEQGEQLDFLAQKAGIATDKLQALSNASSKYGGTTEGTAGTIENLRAKGYKNPETELENIARKMETLKTDAQKWDLANSLGIDEGTTRLLIQGVERYREELKRADKYKLYTKEDLQRMRDYRQIQNDIRMGTESIFGAIYRMLLPAITAVAKIVRGLTDFLAEHEGAVKIAGVFLGIAVAIGAVVAAVNLLSMAVGLLEKHPVVLIIIAIAAAIAALIAIIQDLIVFIQGGESIIGDILKRMGVDTEKLRADITGALQNIGQWFNRAIEWCKSLGGKIAELAQKAKNFWNSLPEPLKKLIGMSNPITGAYTVVTTAQQALATANNNPMNSVPTGVTSNYYQTMARNQNNTSNANSINNSRNSNKNVNISQLTIQTQASDPKGVANALYGSVLSEFDNGIAI